MVVVERNWVIRGFRGPEAVSEWVVRGELLSSQDVIALLQRLQSRHLTMDEIIAASLTLRSTSGTPSVLRVNVNTAGAHGYATIGDTVHYEALLVETDVSPVAARSENAGVRES